MISARGVTRMAGVAAMVLLAAGVVQAVVIDTVPVGNPGNAADPRYVAPGYFGPDRICGAVAYTYNIGKYEVTAGQYTEFLNKVAATDTYGLYNTNMDTAVDSYGCNIKRTGSLGSYTYSVASDWANRPVNWVSFWDACRFANWLHNGQLTGLQNATTTEDGAYTLNGYNGIAGQNIQRNPGWKWAVTSEDEWYKAAYHKNDGHTGNYFDYPTGSDSVPSNDLVNPDPGNNANFAMRWPDDATIGSPYYRTEVGAFENSESPYGTFDQGGNVCEWNEFPVTVFFDYWCCRGTRGGSFGLYGSPEGDRDLHAAYSEGQVPTNEYSFLGFRVSEVPEPATLSLLALGGAALLRRSRRK